MRHAKAGEALAPGGYNKLKGIMDESSLDDVERYVDLEYASEKIPREHLVDIVRRDYKGPLEDIFVI